MLRHHLAFRRCLMVIVASLGVLASSTLAEAAKPVGRFLEVAGKVRVLDASGKPREAEVFGSVYADESLELPANASAVVSFRNGNCERISEVAKATIKESGVEPVSAAKPIKVSAKAQKLVGDSLAELEKNAGGVTVTRSVGTVRPPSIAVSPILGSTVLTTTPTFSWPAKKDAKNYELVLKGARGEKRLWATDTNDIPVNYAGAEKLREDKEYRWEVFVTLESGKVESLCNGSFRTGTAETREAAADLVEIADETEPPLVALAAIRLEELGLFAESIRQYERLVKLAPRRVSSSAGGTLRQSRPNSRCRQVSRISHATRLFLRQENRSGRQAGE